jgi:hypothetical protein
MRISICLLLLVLGTPPTLAAWGHQGHEIVAAAACQDLPAPLAPWFKGGQDTMLAHCNDPDEWKDRDPQEGHRHYLDCEAYGGGSEVPLAIQDAKDRLGPDAFEQDGQVPWVIQDHVQTLAQAFQRGDPDAVVYQAAILCHYVGDINVPLHTSINHDGQLTGQRGVHKRWETGLLERLGSWTPEVRPAALDDHDLADPFTWLGLANALVAPLLRDDQEATRPGPSEPLWNVRTSRYWTEFDRLQGPVVQEQLTLAGERTAQMILLAWASAGKPSPPDSLVREGRGF